MSEMQKLNTTTELIKFIELYKSKNGENVSIQYLAQCEAVKVLTNVNGDWIAGYCVNAQSDFRYLNVLDDYSKKVVLRDKNIQENDLVEITCIWMNREVLKDDFTRLNVYFSSLRDALSTNKVIIIGGSKIMSVWKNFEKPLPNELYFGYIPFTEKLEIGKIVYGYAYEVVEFLQDKTIFDVPIVAIHNLPVLHK